MGVKGRIWVLVLSLGVTFAGCSGGAPELSVDHVVEHPQVADLSDWRVDAAERAGLEPDPLWDAYGAREVEAALEAGFRNGAGDELFKLKLALVPSAVMFALERGDGDPGVIGDASWLGQVDHALHNAIRASGYEPPEPRDLQGIGDVAAQGLLPLLASSHGYDADDPVVDKIRKELNSLDLRHTVPSTSRQQNRLVFIVFQMHQVMWLRGHIDLEPGRTPADAGPHLLASPLVPILTSGGDLIEGADGEPLTAEDWFGTIGVVLWHGGGWLTGPGSEGQ